MNRDFVNLHLHTHYSVGDATIKIPQLFYTVKEYGQKAVAITDHGTVEGWSEFFNVSQDTNIKPIFGNEFYCKDMLEKPVDRTRFHLVVLAKNDQGARTISKLQMIANRHHHYKPLLPYPILFENTENLFISTACSLGTIGQALDPKMQSKTFKDGENFLNTLLDKFGKENVSLEFQFHPDYPGQGIINEKLLDLYEKTDVKYCIVTTDAHYLNNRNTRRNLQADSWNKSVKEITPTLESNCFGTPTKIKKFAEDSNFSDLALVDTMIKNTNIIADKCNVNNINNIGQPRVLPRFKKHDNFKKIFLKDPRCKHED